MQRTVTIPFEEYQRLKHTAKLLDDIIEEEHLSEKDLEKIKQAEKTPKMTKEEFYSRHPDLKHNC